MEQREKIKEFDKELFSATGQVAWFAPGIFSFLLLILFAIPIQEISGESRYMIAIGASWAFWIAYLVLLPYETVTNKVQTKKNKTFGRLKYLPVSAKQYRTVRMGYLFRFVKRLALIGLVLQCTAAFLVLKK